MHDLTASNNAALTNKLTNSRLAMIVDRYKFFRWTPRTAGITIAYVLVVPAFFGYLGYAYDVSFYSASF